MEKQNGYYSVFRSPLAKTSTGKPAVYTICGVNVSTIIIPLTSGFTDTVLDLIIRAQTDDVFIIAPDMGTAFISDYYNVYHYTTNVLHRNLTIYTAKLPELDNTSPFAMCVKKVKGSIAIGSGEGYQSKDMVNISLLEAGNKVHPNATDILIQDHGMQDFFVSCMSEEKAKYLLNRLHTMDFTIHMPYEYGSYGGMSYSETIELCPELAGHIVCNQFGSSNELTEAYSKGLDGRMIIL